MGKKDGIETKHYHHFLTWAIVMGTALGWSANNCLHLIEDSKWYETITTPQWLGFSNILMK